MLTDAEIRTRLSERLVAIESRINAACARAGRDRAAVTLIAVTKTVSPRVAGLLPDLGLLDLGESRPQELWRKAEALKNWPIRWHFIGHLQRNKVERTLPLVHRIHTVDSERLLEAIAAEGVKAGIRPKVLLQINASREEQKHGFTFDEFAGLKDTIARLPVEVSGVMCMAADADDPELARPAFAELRLRCRWWWAEWKGFAQNIDLSMGMSGDFEVAIEEGATYIRIGSTLFEGLENE